MIEVTRNLFVGNEEDYNRIQHESDWAIVHACKEPYHRIAVGYSGRGAPKRGGAEKLDSPLSGNLA